VSTRQRSPVGSKADAPARAWTAASIAPRCQVFYDVLRGHPLVAPPAHRRLPSLTTVGSEEA